MADHEDIHLEYGNAAALFEFCARCFNELGVPEEDARIAAEVLLESDLRGIESHGVPRFEAFYINGLKDGRINPKANVRVVHEAPATALVDGDGGLGMLVGYRSMEVAIRKAAETGAGFVSTRNSRHFGIAGFYASMALKHDMIGWTVTNASPQMPPSGGADPRLGTNPLAFAAPSADGRDFILDMATTTVAGGKLEIAERKHAKIPLGWAYGTDKQLTDDPGAGRRARRMTPLGSTREMSDHKGSGLSAMIDILSGILSGGLPTALQMDWRNVSHFFGALRIDGFRPVDDFKGMMADWGDAVRTTPPLPGVEQVILPGDKERAARADRLEHGIPLYPETVESLRRVGRDLKLECPV